MDRVIEDKRWIKKKYWKYITGVVILLALLAFVVFQDNESTFRVEWEKISIAKVYEGPFQDYINIVGQVEPISIVSVEALEEGRVEEILLEEGTMVQQGDVIMRLSNEDLNLSFLDEEASFAYLTYELNDNLIKLDQEELTEQQNLLLEENDLNEKQRLYEKTENLHEKGGVSDEEYISTKSSYEIALANYQITIKKMKLDSASRDNQRTQINFQIQAIGQKLDNLKVKAPVDGLLSLGDIELGESIFEGTKIGQISVLSSYKIKAQIDEHYIDRVQQGLTATFERQEDTFQLILAKVFPEVVSSVFEVDLRFQGELPQNIRMGQSYYIDLQLGETQDAIQLARGGFFQSTGGQWVYVLRPGRFDCIQKRYSNWKTEPTKL